MYDIIDGYNKPVTLIDLLHFKLRKQSIAKKDDQ